MKPRRRFSDVKRAFIRALGRMNAYRVETEAEKIREYAVARRFLHGSSVDRLVENNAIGGGAWNRDRVEQAIRNRTTGKR